MHHQHLGGRAILALEIGQQIFGAAAEAADAPSGQALGKALRQRPAQIGAAGDGLHDPLALHHRRKAATHGFDFGQFGHGLILSAGALKAHALSSI